MTTSIGESMEIESSTNQTKLASSALPEILEMPKISEYLDYRLFLSDFYKFKRNLTAKDIRPYSYAMFSAAANIKSPNYLKMIIEGRRNLSEEMIGKFAKAMGLMKEQGEEFRLMVLFGQTTDPAERNMFLKQLNEHRVNSKLKAGEIDQKTWEKVPSWVAWILFTMIDQKGVKFQPERLRELLRGQATIDEIELALKSLLDSKEVVIAEDGTFKRSNQLMEDAAEIPVALVRKLQTELMYLGLESLFRDSATDREFGSLTLAMTRAEFEEVRFQLRQFRKKTQKENAVKRADGPGERVYQMNLQLFPVTEKA
ncbi:MAG: TIGR02147 family protein [Pseudobdellovibrionaceae bacterium]